MRIDDFQDLDLSEEELLELEQSLDLIGQTIEQEEEILLPDSLRGEALLHLLDGVEQDEPEPQQEKRKSAGKLILGVFPQKYLAAAAMLALAVMVGAAYSRLPRTEKIDTSVSSVAPESQQIPEEDSEAAPDAALYTLQRLDGYASVLKEIDQRYNRDDKPVYDRKARLEAESPPEADQQKPNPQAGEETAVITGQPEQESVQQAETTEAVETDSPEENGQDSAAMKGGLMQVPSPYQSSTESQEDTSGSDTSDQVAADQGLFPSEDGADWEGAAEEPAASQFSSGTAVSDLSVTSDSGFTYTLVPDLQNRQQAVFEIRAAETMEPIRVEITNEEPILYRQVLYGDDSLIVVGDLLEYPDSYLCMTRTVYEEMGLEALGSGSDRRDDYVEMTQISVYRIAEQNQAELSHSQDYYQAGWYRTASMAEDGTLYTATDKNIYGAEGSTEYLTEVIPVVGSQTEMNYLDSSRIYVDRYSTELDSYAVISSLDLSQPAECMETVAYLGEQMPVVRIADDGVYLGCTIAGEQGDYSRMLRFDGQDLSVVTASEDLGGLLVPQSFVSLPDTGCAVLIDQQNGTGRGISECVVLVLDWGLGTVATVPVAISPDEILWVEVSNQIMLVRTASQIYQIDLSTPLSPEVSVWD